MTVQNLLSSSVPPLAGSDTVGQALYRLAEHGVGHLPVVGVDGDLVGLVGEADLRAHPSPETPLAALIGAEPVSVTPDTHVFDAAHRMLQHGLSLMPVTAADGRYIGLVVRPALFGQLAHMLATEEPGAIVVLEGARRDFSLAQLAHLIEQNGVRILSVSTEDDPDAGFVRVTLKLNVGDTARVRHLMEHHGYRIVALFDEQDADLQGRVDEFLRYLEV